MWGYHDGMGWWMVFGGVWAIAIWAAVIGLVVWGINRIAGGRGDVREAAETPLEIARRRLARGEIDKAQFEELREALR